jgi:hypothetical protein
MKNVLVITNVIRKRRNENFLFSDNLVGKGSRGNVLATKLLGEKAMKKLLALLKTPFVPFFGKPSSFYAAYSRTPGLHTKLHPHQP